MGRMVAVLVFEKARYAQMIGLADSASDHLGFIDRCQKSESTGGNLQRAKPLTFETPITDSLLHLHSRDWRERGGLWHSGWNRSWKRLPCLLLLFVLFLDLQLSRSNGLSCAVGNNTIFDKSFDQPMVFNWAGDACVNTLRTQVIVTILADTAVVVLTGDRSATIVAVDAESSGGRSVRDDGKTGIVRTWHGLPVARLCRDDVIIRPLRRGLVGIGRQIRSRPRNTGESTDMRYRQRGTQNSVEVAVLCCRFLLLRWDLLGSRLWDNERRRCCTWQIDHDGLDTKLQFGFGSAVKLFVDSHVFTVKANVAGGAIGIALKDDVDIRRNAKELPELLRDRPLVCIHRQHDVVRRKQGNGIGNIMPTIQKRR